MSKKLTNEEFLQRLNNSDIKYIPLEEYDGIDKKIKWLCCKNQNHVFESSPWHIFDGKGCPYCSGRLAFIGETDLWTTRPDVANMLLNPDDGYKYMAGSGKKVDWVCPICGRVVKNKKICNISNKGLCCPFCSDGISFSEKYLMSLFNQLQINFDYDNIRKWSNKKKI